MSGLTFFFFHPPTSTPKSWTTCQTLRDKWLEFLLAEFVCWWGGSLICCVHSVCPLRSDCKSNSAEHGRNQNRGVEKGAFEWSHRWKETLLKCEIWDQYEVKLFFVLNAWLANMQIICWVVVRWCCQLRIGGDFLKLQMYLFKSLILLLTLDVAFTSLVRNWNSGTR